MDTVNDRHHFQTLIARDLSNRPFAFVPLLCRLYSLSEAEVPTQLEADQRLVVDARHLPEIHAEILSEIDAKGVEGILRRHESGIALIVSQNCNLGCSYCLAKQGTFGLPVATMKLDEVKRRIEALFEAHPNLDFVKFFGGEPTLRMDLIEAVCAFVSDDLGKHVHFAITTNGTTRAERHLPVWERYRVSVGVSVDGPQEIHDAIRIKANGKGSFKEAVRYCETLEKAQFPFAAIGVFDRRHISAGLSYLDTIQYLNRFSPLVKVQFVEALGDAVTESSIPELDCVNARKQVYQAVDKIVERATLTWVSPRRTDWVYDNNLYRFLFGIYTGKATPYQHACTASHLSTIFPSGEMTPCYTFSEHPELRLGSKNTLPADVETSRKQFQDSHTWQFLSNAGVTVPWYRGVVGDICVADMMNSGGKESSRFYKLFQESAVFRILQHIPLIAANGEQSARLANAVTQHYGLTTKFTAQPGAMHHEIN